MNNLDHPKLWIVDYYDSMINEIDVRCETIFSMVIKQHLENEEDGRENEIQTNLNGIRARFIQEITAVQESNLLQYEKNSVEIYKKFEQISQIENDHVQSVMIDELKRTIFSRDYCFLITNHLDLMMHTHRSTRLGLKLVVCDWYLDENQVEYLRKLLTNSIHEIVINEVIGTLF